MAKITRSTNTKKAASGPKIFIAGQPVSDELAKQLRKQYAQLNDKVSNDRDTINSVKRTLDQLQDSLPNQEQPTQIVMANTFINEGVSSSATNRSLSKPSEAVKFSRAKEGISEFFLGKGWEEVKANWTDVFNNPLRKNEQTGKRHLINPELSSTVWKNKGRLLSDFFLGKERGEKKDAQEFFQSDKEWEFKRRESLASRLNPADRQNKKREERVEEILAQLAGDEKRISNTDFRIQEMLKLLTRTESQDKIKALTALLSKKGGLSGSDFEQLESDFESFDKALLSPRANRSQESSIIQGMREDQQVEYTKASYEEEIRVYKLLQTNFDNVDQRLKDIKTAIETSGGNTMSTAGGVADTIKDLATTGGSKAGKFSKWLGRLGTAATVAYGGYKAYTGYNEASQMQSQGLITADEAKERKGKALGKGGGTIAGSLVGGAAGAAVGSVVPIIGTAIGGLLGAGLGGMLGDWGGEKLGGYLATIGKIESGLNPNAKASTSSATGMFQFTEGTWKNLSKKYGKDYTLDDRTDTKKSAEMAALFTLENKQTMEKNLGRSVSDSELYMAHFMGAGNKNAGATKFYKSLESNPDALGADLFGKEAQANQSIFYDKAGKARSLKDISNLMESKYKKHEVVAPMTFDENSKSQYVISETEKSEWIEGAKKKEVTNDLMAKSLALRTGGKPPVPPAKTESQVVTVPTSSGNLSNKSIFDDVALIHLNSGLVPLNLLT